MTKLISKEQFQERLESKRENLLEQKRKSIEEEISIILRKINMEKLSEEDQLKIRESAKNIAEQKNYDEDYKLKILNNIQKNAEENHFWEEIDKNEWLNVFSDITNDIVYQRMAEKWDIENIKLFLERKLDVETYLEYLTDNEIKDLWIEGMYLLIKKMKEEWDNVENMENIDTSVNIQEEEIKSEIISENIINNVEETTVVEEWKAFSEQDLHSISNAVNYFVENWMAIKNGENVEDIINNIKYKIYRRSMISKRSWGKEDFLNNNNWIEIEKADIPQFCKVWDKFQIYCASALVGWFITVEIKWKENDNDNVNAENNWEIEEISLSKSVINEIQTIKNDIENIFNYDELLINDFVNTFINLRIIWCKSLKEEFRNWMTIEEYKNSQWWNDLQKHLIEMQENYEWLKNITQQLWKIITNLKKEGQLKFNQIKSILLR